MFLAPFDRSKTFVIPNSKKNLSLILILKDLVGTDNGYLHSCTNYKIGSSYIIRYKIMCRKDLPKSRSNEISDHINVSK